MIHIKIQVKDSDFCLTLSGYDNTNAVQTVEAIRLMLQSIQFDPEG